MALTVWLRREIQKTVSIIPTSKGSSLIRRRSEPPKRNKKKEQGVELDTEISELLALVTFR